VPLHENCFRNLPYHTPKLPVNGCLRKVVTQFEIGAHILIAGCPLHTQAMRPLQAVKFKLSHYPLDTELASGVLTSHPPQLCAARAPVIAGCPRSRGGRLCLTPMI
jgi:hypothetical protein